MYMYKILTISSFSWRVKTPNATILFKKLSLQSVSSVNWGRFLRIKSLSRLSIGSAIIALRISICLKNSMNECISIMYSTYYRVTGLFIDITFIMDHSEFDIKTWLHFLGSIKQIRESRIRMNLLMYFNWIK